MPPHPLVHSGVLRTLQRMTDRLGPVLLETIPSEEQISQFFHTLQSLSHQPIQTRLYFDPADHTIYVSRSHRDVSIHLSTVTHDYTSHCASPFTDNWQNPAHAGNAHLIPEVIDHFDDLQRHLLQFRPAYLHHVSSQPALSTHDVDDTRSSSTLSSTSHFRVFTSYRFASHPEPPLLHAAAAVWKSYTNNGVVRLATSAEATVWAVAHLVPSNPQLDLHRLRHISAVVRAVFAQSPSRRTIPCGNTTALLEARQCASRNNYGRVRHCIIHAAVYDKSLIHHGPSFCSATEEPAPFLPPVSVSRFPRIIRITISIIFLVIFLAFALSYTFSENRNGSRNILTIVLWLIVAVSLIELISTALTRRLPSSASELLRYAKRGGSRLQVEAATGLLARTTYNGAWLSFSGLRFQGRKEYDGVRFNVSQLLIAGYELAFCMDGREALIAPNNTFVRLKTVTPDGGAVFEKAESEDPQLQTAVVPGVRGTWAADIVMGRSAKSYHVV